MTGLLHGQLRIGGSDLMEPHFREAIVEYATARDLDVAVHFAGSYPAVDALKKGEIDLAILAIPDGGDVPEGDLRSVHLASKALAIVVPQANPLNQITLLQLAAIFGEAEASNVTRWGQLGLTGDWASRSISLGSVSRQDHTLAVDLFRHQVLQSREMKRNVAESPGVEAIRLRMQQDQHGIALVDRIPSRLEGIKLLPVARSETELAVGPSLQSISNSDYPLRLPLYLVFARDRAGDLKEILRYLVSEEAAEAIAACGLTPLSDQQRQGLYFEFERL